MYVRGDVATLRNSLGAIARLADGRGVCVCVCVCVLGISISVCVK